MTRSLILVALSFVAAWSLTLSFQEKPLTVAFLDVGQGDAIFIESPTGVQVLIDGGAGSGVLRELGSVMSFEDRSIDVVIATHPDTDHIGGLVDVLERYHVAYIFESGSETETNTYRAFNKAVSEEGAVRIEARAGTYIHLGGGAILEILYPVHDASSLEPNEASIVARLVYRDAEVLLTGDAPISVERVLLQKYGNTLESDVLKVGHHGSRTSTAKVFVDVVRPQIAVISAGKENRYGHPHEEVVAILENADATVLHTMNGTIVMKSFGEGFMW